VGYTTVSRVRSRLGSIAETSPGNEAIEEFIDDAKGVIDEWNGSTFSFNPDSTSLSTTERRVRVIATDIAAIRVLDNVLGGTLLNGNDYSIEGFSVSAGGKYSEHEALAKRLNDEVTAGLNALGRKVRFKQTFY
jgi:hypothetical protein